MTQSISCPRREYLGNPEQFAYAEKFLFDDGPGAGMRGIRVSTGAGLVFTILPDRGMDLWRAEFLGRTFSWISPCGPKRPDLLEHGDFSWLRNWGGGLLTTAGLQNVGSPCDFQGVHHTLHGRISNIPAQAVSIRRIHANQGSHDPKAEDILEISGEVHEVSVFGEHLKLSRKISLSAGSNKIRIQDHIENAGFKSAPAQILYHMNLGWPLLSENSVLAARKHAVTPRNETALKGIRMWDQCEPPQPSYEEQCFYHDIPADEDGFARISLFNPINSLRFTVAYLKEELPFFTQWKQMGQGEYVLGLEPATCHPEGLNAE